MADSPRKWQFTITLGEAARTCDEQFRMKNNDIFVRRTCAIYPTNLQGGYV